VLLPAALIGFVGVLLMMFAVLVSTWPEPEVVLEGEMLAVLEVVPVLGLEDGDRPGSPGPEEGELGVTEPEDEVEELEEGEVLEVGLDAEVPVRLVPVALVCVDPTPVVVPVDPTVPLVPAVVDPVAMLGVIELVVVVLPVPGVPAGPLAGTSEDVDAARPVAGACAGTKKGVDEAGPGPGACARPGTGAKAIEGAGAVTGGTPLREGAVRLAVEGELGAASACAWRFATHR